MKINSKNERKKFLELNIKDMGSYALVTYNNHIRPIWIHRYENWDENGDWFLEAPCELKKYKFKNQDDATIREFVEVTWDDDHMEEGIEYIKSMTRDGWLYEIDCPQVAPFLPDVLDDLTLISEGYCLEWILNNQ